MATYKTAFYVAEFLRPKALAGVIDRCVAYLRDGKFDFDTIAFRGMSGALVAPSVALALRKELIMVRKGESSHSYHNVEGYTGAERVVIIDDLVSSGATARAIREGVKEIAPTAEILGVLEYTQMSYGRYNGEFLCQYWMDTL